MALLAKKTLSTTVDAWEHVMKRSQTIIYWFIVVSQWRLGQTTFLPQGVKNVLLSFLLSMRTSSNEPVSENEVVTAIFTDDIDLLKHGLALDHSLLWKPIAGFTLLERAVASQAFRCAELLIHHGSPCRNALSSVRCVEGVMLLLDKCHEARVDIPDNDNRLPLAVAASRGFTDVCLFMLNHGATPDRDVVRLARVMHHEDTARAIENFRHDVEHMISLVLLRQGVPWCTTTIVLEFM